MQLSRELKSVDRCFKDWFKPSLFDYNWPAGIYSQSKEGVKSTACYFLHGALHLIDEPESKLTLDEFDSTKNVKLTQKIQEAWKRGCRPLFTSEGKSALKLRRIESSVYLRHAFEEFKRLLRNNDIVICGASLSEQDQHLVDAINNSNANNVILGIHAPTGSNDPRLAAWSKKITSSEVQFFDASSKGCWIY